VIFFPPEIARAAVDFSNPTWSRISPGGLKIINSHVVHARTTHSATPQLSTGAKSRILIYVIYKISMEYCTERILDIPLNATCYVTIAGSYTDITMVPDHTAFCVFRGLAFENGRISFSRNVSGDIGDIVADARVLAKTIIGKCTVCVYDDEFIHDMRVAAIGIYIDTTSPTNDNASNIDKVITIRDIRRKGVAERLEDIRSTMDKIQRQLDMMSEVLDAVDDADGFAPERKITTPVAATRTGSHTRHPAVQRDPSSDYSDGNSPAISCQLYNIMGDLMHDVLDG